MSYNSLNLMNGDFLTLSHIRHLESGIRDIEDEVSNMRNSLINILRDKGINKPDNCSFDELYREITYLQKEQSKEYEYSESIIDIRDVESGKIKMVFSDVNSGQAGFYIYAVTGIRVDWGDGKVETFTTTATSQTHITHTYAVGGGEYLDGTNTQYVATVEPLSENGITGFKISDKTSYRNSLLSYSSKDIYYKYSTSAIFANSSQLQYVYIYGGSFGVSETQFSMASICESCTKLKVFYMPNIVWNNVTSLANAFYSCYALKTLYLGESCDSVNCTSFYRAFSECRQLTNAPNFKTTSATTLEMCFYNCVMLEAVEGSWDLSSCLYFNSTFYNCKLLTQLPLLNNMYNITTMNTAFYYCSSLINFKEEQTLLNTESCSNFAQCFAYCASLEEIPEIDFSSATSIYMMFYECRSLFILPSILNFPNVSGTSYTYTDPQIRSDLDGLFYNCTSLTTAPTIIAPKALNAFQMFYGCTSLVNVPDIDLPEVIRAHQMFYGCTSLITAPHHISLPKAQNICQMFYNCAALKTAPEYQVGEILSFPEALYAYEMFYGCLSLVNAPKNIELNKATHIYSMFYSNASLINAPGTITAPVCTHTYSLFYGCTKLENPPVRLSFPSALNCYQMFYLCQSLLVCPELDLPKATNINSMFYGCSALTSTIEYTFPSATNAQSFYRGCTSLISIDLVKLGGASCDIRYFYHEPGSKLNTAYFPEAINDAHLIWADWCFSLATGNTFRKYSNIVDCSYSSANVSAMHDCVYIENISLKGFYGTLSVINRSNLSSVRLYNASENIGNINLSGNKLDTEAINQLFEDLPTVPTARTINVRSNPGASTCDTSIATAKNWVVTVV